MVFAHQWHPIGTAIGEPEAESSTPTFHQFGRWDREPVTLGEQLLLPTQRRVPAAEEELAEYDGGLRTALRRLAGEHSGEPASPEAAPLPELIAAAPPLTAGDHHAVVSPASDGALTAGLLLALGAAVQGLTGGRGVTGLSCVAPDPGSVGREVHALGRSAGESVNPLQEFLNLPEVSHALL
ncbi:MULTISPECIES: hypothetical protein [unclassified Arthrobacter]|uniref:hypothetical protein n=1 Tax=unclassified Arthrobacter TaxID=235627 RepID=UPI0033938EC1